MIAFGVLAVAALVASVLVVASRNPLISALWLALTLTAVAGIFVILDAQFLAAIQIIVYAGAILVFFLFVIMLLNVGQLQPGDRHPVQRYVGVYLSLVVATTLAFVLHSGDGYGAHGPADAAQVAEVGNTAAVGAVLYRDYVFPFEITGLLLTAAVVGAVALAGRPDDGPEEGA